MIHGVSGERWNAAKEEARAAMVKVARRSCTLSYSDLVQEIASYKFDPHDFRLPHLLGEIGAEEDAAGRGILTAVVVYHTGPKRPGPGFFVLAKHLGRDTSDTDGCWIEELQKVHEAWA